MTLRITRRQMLVLGAQAATVAGVSAVLPLAAQTGVNTAGRNSAALEAVSAYAERHLAEMRAPGMTLAVADGSGPLGAFAFGYSNLESKERVRPEHLFQIGSITKSFAAIALLQLREEGKLDLHRPVVEYLPWLKVETKYKPFSAHHLLTHSAGLPGNAPLFLAPGQSLWTSHAPGEHFHYCNLGYDILGRLIEALDGRPWPESVRRRIFEPLQMTSSEPVIQADVRLRVAGSYLPAQPERPMRRGGVLAPAPWIFFDFASGSICSTAADMARYMQMIVNGGKAPRGRVLSEQAFADFVKPVIAAPSFGEGAHYGYGLAVSQLDGRKIVRHTGGMVSFSSAMQIDLDTGVGAFASVNANLQGYRPNPVAVFALKALHAERKRQPMPPQPPVNDPNMVEKAAEYAGSYKAMSGKADVEVQAQGSRLFLLHGGKRVPLQQRGSDVFLALDPAFELFTLRFGRDDNKKVVELAHGPDWWASSDYAGKREFKTPREYEQFTGTYHNNNPWEGTARVVLRKGQLWLEGAEPLVPLGENTFRIGEEEYSPERARFESVVQGKAQRAMFSEVAYDRVRAR